MELNVNHRFKTSPINSALPDVVPFLDYAARTWSGECSLVWNEDSRKNLEHIFGHNPFAEALYQMPRAQFSSRVWVLALTGKIKVTEMHIRRSQSGAEIQESFVKKKKKSRRLEKKYFQIEIAGGI